MNEHSKCGFWEEIFGVPSNLLIKFLLLSFVRTFDLWQPYSSVVSDPDCEAKKDLGKLCESLQWVQNFWPFFYCNLNCSLEVELPTSCKRYLNVLIRYKTLKSNFTYSKNLEMASFLFK